MNILDTWVNAFPALLGGLVGSMALAALSLVIGLPLGLVLAVLSGARSRVLRYGTVTLVEIGRGLPALLILQLFYFGLPSIEIVLSAFLAAAFGLALTTAAYTSEVIRGGLNSVPVGEVEAAVALNFNAIDALRFVVIPQGLRVALPALMSYAILIFQGTALAYSIAYPELLGAAYSYGSSTFRYLEVLALAGLMYAAITIPAGYVTQWVERRLSRHLA